MSFLNFILQGFGFDNLNDFRLSAFKHMITSKVVTWSLIVGFLESFLQTYLGLPLIVFSSFVLLNLLEFHTGVLVAKRKGKNIESRKMGRMFLKVGVYLLILFMLQSFMTGLKFPEVSNYEIDPFIVLYWAFLTGVIYQLFKSLLENLEGLGYKEANGILGYITRKFGNDFKSDKDFD
jgi:hypothetical protein